VEYLVFSTLEELAESSEDTIKQEFLPLVHEEYEEDIVLSSIE